MSVKQYVSYVFWVVLVLGSAGELLSPPKRTRDESARSDAAASHRQESYREFQDFWTEKFRRAAADGPKAQMMIAVECGQGIYTTLIQARGSALMQFSFGLADVEKPEGPWSDDKKIENGLVSESGVVLTADEIQERIEYLEELLKNNKDTCEADPTHGELLKDPAVMALVGSLVGLSVEDLNMLMDVTAKAQAGGAGFEPGELERLAELLERIHI